MGADITQDYFEVLDKMTGASWTCKTCLGIQHKIKQEIQLINVRQAEMRSDVDSNIDRISRLEKKQESSESARQADRDLIFEELQERENRKDNLVIHNLLEPLTNLSRGGERKEHNVKYVLDVFEYIRCRLNRDVFKFIYRAGERTKLGKPRPLILGLRDTKARENILSNSEN